VLVLSVDLITGSGDNQPVTDATTMQTKMAPMSAAGAQSDDATTSDVSGGSVAQEEEQEQERTTGGEAANSEGEAATPKNGAEAFGFGTVSTPASDSAAGSAPAPEEGAVVATPDASTLTAEQDTGMRDAAQSPANDDNRLRLVETGLAMLIVWLLIAMIAIPHLRRQSGNPR